MEENYSNKSQPNDVFYVLRRLVYVVCSDVSEEITASNFRVTQD